MWPRGAHRPPESRAPRRASGRRTHAPARSRHRLTARRRLPARAGASRPHSARSASGWRAPGTAPARPSTPAQARRSLDWARLTLRLASAGALARVDDGRGVAGGPAPGPVRTADHLATVIVLQDRELAWALVRARLGPLQPLPAGERARLTETLAAWLAHQRHTPRIAAELHVHPQTVRYRIARLRELLGDDLDSPDARFELALALRIEAAGALAAPRRPSSRSSPEPRAALARRPRGGWPASWGSASSSSRAARSGWPRSPASSAAVRRCSRPICCRRTPPSVSARTWRPSTAGGWTCSSTTPGPRGGASSRRPVGRMCGATWRSTWRRRCGSPRRCCRSCGRRLGPRRIARCRRKSHDPRHDHPRPPRVDRQRREHRLAVRAAGFRRLLGGHAARRLTPVPA